jgi:hypothetical protein
MVYEWKNGSRISADAQKVGEELERIETKNAASVLRAAKAKGSELHKCFEWEDSIAAEAHRMEQARAVLRFIVTIIEVSNDGEIETVQVRAYESVRFATDDDEPDTAMTYIPTREALSDPELRSQVMDRLESVISEAEQTAKDYTYLVPTFKRTKEKLQEARETVRA